MTGTVRALLLIRDNQIRMPGQFARLMWPNSPYWDKVYNVGHGATKGVGMWKAGGSLLGKLAQGGLIRRPWYNDRDDSYALTDKGREFLSREMPE